MKSARHNVWLLVGVAACVSLFAVGAAHAQEGAPPAPPGPVAQEHNNVRPAIKWKRFDYNCDEGAKITVFLHDTSVKVYFKDRLYLMRQTPSADGTRYSDGKVIWWSKGDDGFLQEDSEDGEGQKIVKDCYLVQTPAAVASTRTVTGTITYLARIALPAQAVVQLQLQDLSREGEAAVVAEEKFTLGDRGSPLPFTLKVDAAKIDVRRTYGIAARIAVQGEPRFATKEPYKVLTQGNPSKVDMVLLPAGGPRP